MVVEGRRGGTFSPEMARIVFFISSVFISLANLRQDSLGHRSSIQVRAQTSATSMPLLNHRGQACMADEPWPRPHWLHVTAGYVES